MSAQKNKAQSWIQRSGIPSHGQSRFRVFDLRLFSFFGLSNRNLFLRIRLDQMLNCWQSWQTNSNFSSRKLTFKLGFPLFANSGSDRRQCPLTSHTFGPGFVKCLETPQNLTQIEVTKIVFESQKFGNASTLGPHKRQDDIKVAFGGANVRSDWNRWPPLEVMEKLLPQMAAVASLWHSLKSWPKNHVLT